MSEVNPEEDIEEPTEYTTEPEPDADSQDDNAEGSVSELMRDHDVNP